MEMERREMRAKRIEPADDVMPDSIDSNGRLSDRLHK